MELVNFDVFDNNTKIQINFNDPVNEVGYATDPISIEEFLRKLSDAFLPNQAQAKTPEADK